MREKLGVLVSESYFNKVSQMFRYDKNNSMMELV